MPSLEGGGGGIKAQVAWLNPTNFFQIWSPQLAHCHQHLVWKFKFWEKRYPSLQRENLCRLFSQMVEYITFQQKRDVIALKRQFLFFCTIVTTCVLLCYTAIGHFRWVRWDPKWPWAPWQWVGMTFQAFRGSSGAQIAFTILLATSIGDRVTQCTAHERGVANAVKVGQNHFFRK